MNADGQAAHDLSFLTDGRPYLTSRQAAKFAGYEPGVGGVRTDPQMRCFYTWAWKRHVKPLPGRGGMYRRSDLVDAMERRASDDKLGAMENLARDLAAGRGRPRLVGSK